MDYEIITISGRSKELFPLVGPFAMDRKVIRELDGYPILADDNTEWYIAIIDKKVIGFSAIQYEKEDATFNYSYVIPDYRKNGVQKALFSAMMKDVKSNKDIKLIKADCTEVILPIYKKAGFKVVKEFQKWTKVEKAI